MLNLIFLNYLKKTIKSYVRSLYFFFCIGFLIFQSACGFQDNKNQFKIQEGPLWTRKIPNPDKEYVYFVGISSQHIEQAAAEKEAQEMAMQACFEFIKLKGQASYVSQRSQKGRTIKDIVTIETGEIVVKGIKEVETFVEEDIINSKKEITVFKLIGLPQSELTRIKNLEIENLNAYQESIQNLNSALLSYDIRTVYFFLKQAKHLGKKVDESSQANLNGVIVNKAMLDKKLEEDVFRLNQLKKNCYLKFITSTENEALTTAIRQIIENNNINLIKNNEKKSYFSYLVSVTLLSEDFQAEIKSFQSIVEIEQHFIKGSQVEKIQKKTLKSAEILASKASFAIHEISQTFAMTVALEIKDMMDNLETIEW